MSATRKSSLLPSAMEGKLRSIRRRQTGLALLQAVAVGISVLIAGMVLAMAFDWAVTLFDTRWRTALTLLAVGLATAALLATGVPAVRAARRWLHAASDVDGGVPALEERWTTVASFTQSPHTPGSTTAQSMLQQVTSEAAAMERLVEPGQIARPATLRPAALALGACLLGLIGFLSLNWQQTSVLLARFWSPRTNITATQLTSFTGDVTIPRGETFHLGSSLSGMQRPSATLEIQHPSGVSDHFDLTATEQTPTEFVHTLRAEGSFRYRMRAGDGQTPWHQVQVVDHPAFDQVRFTITAPEYVDRPRYEKPLIPSRVKVAQGSRLDLHLKPQSEIERLELTLSAEDIEGEPLVQSVLLTPDKDGWYRFQSQLLHDLTLQPVMRNRHGLTNEDRATCRFQVIADKAPVARVVSPTDEMAVAVDDVIDIQFEAHDDYGIATAELVVYDETATVEGQEPKILSVQPIPLGDQQGEQHVMAQTQLDLKNLGLAEGTQISYAVRVTDNRSLPADAPPGSVSQSDVMADTGAPTGPQTESSGNGRDAERVDEPGDRETPGTSGEQQSTDEPPAQLASAVAKMPADREGSNNQATTAATDQPPVSEAPSESDAAARKPRAEADSPRVAENTAAETMSTTSKEQRLAESETEEPTAIAATEADGKPAARDPRQSSPSVSESPRVEEGQSGTPRTADADANRQPAPNSDDPSLSQSAAAGSSANAGTSAADKLPAADPDGSGEEPGEVASAAAMASLTERTLVGELTGHPLKRDGNQPGEERIASAAGSSQSKMPQESDQPDMLLGAQQSESGQNTETNRRRLKITERLMAVASADSPRDKSTDLRERVLAIDAMLAGIEEGLTHIVQRTIPDADHLKQYERLDTRLGEVESYIADLRIQTQDHELAFVGLQMVDIGRTHITPARDEVFAATSDATQARRNATNALQHVVRARELLAALLKRYDRVKRDRELADALEESVEMYEIYVEKRHRLMREALQNKNPLQRKMSVIEVDQDYLDRYAEVFMLRREMLTEFARMLADDPRLLARYLDQLKRRRSSLRDQLSELAERQYEQATELSGWMAISDQQRDNLWRLMVDMRLQATTPLASDAAELAERVDKQLPLQLEPTVGTAFRVLGHARAVARIARDIAFDTRDPQPAAGDSTWTTTAGELVFELTELNAALNQLIFENETEDEVTSYVTARLLESRAVADQADHWRRIVRSLAPQTYHQLIEIDQQRMAVATELLRVDMLEFEDDLNGQFQRIAESDVPGEIIDLVRQLHRVIEGITYDQAAATFAMNGNALPVAQRRQAAAVAGFEQAEDLFDQIRRAVIAELDQYEEDDPNIADLQDPTLDEFLARLEREPNIEAQLGIPNRPRNLRVIAELMSNSRPNGDLLGDSENAAMRRARDAMTMRRPPQGDPPPPESEMTEQERQQRAQQQQMQQMLEKSLAALQDRIDDPQTPDPQRRKLEQMAENLQRMLEQTGQPAVDEQAWRRIAESDQARAILEALARGEALPDEQWNKLFSTLDDGLWQVRGRTPPEQYRRAIEQYQDRIRQLMDTIEDDAA